MIYTEERNLIDACYRGERYAQKQLYEQYCNGMMQVCCRYIKEREDAKEVLSDGFLTFFKNIKQFTYQGDGSLQAWLKKIIINQCLMHLRKNPGPQIIDISDVEAAASINESALSNLNAKEIIKLIQELPTGYRIVFNLYFFENKNVGEIAAMLSVSENTAKSQLRKAKLTLQKKIQELI